MDDVLLRAVIRTLIESDEDEPMGLKLPDIKDSSTTRGDDTVQDRALMRLNKVVKDAPEALKRLHRNDAPSQRSGLRVGKDVDVDTNVAINTGNERRSRQRARKALSTLDRSTKSSDRLNPSVAVDALKKVSDDTSLHRDSKRLARQVKLPRVDDVARDITVASKPDDDGEQQSGLKDIVKSTVAVYADALNTSSANLDAKSERDIQHKKDVRS